MSHPTQTLWNFSAEQPSVRSVEKRMPNSPELNGYPKSPSTMDNPSSTLENVAILSSLRASRQLTKAGKFAAALQLEANKVLQEISLAVDETVRSREGSDVNFQDHRTGTIQHLSSLRSTAETTTVLLESAQKQVDATWQAIVSRHWEAAFVKHFVEKCPRIELNRHTRNPLTIDQETRDGLSRLQKDLEPSARAFQEAVGKLSKSCREPANEGIKAGAKSLYQLFNQTVQKLDEFRSGQLGEPPHEIVQWLNNRLTLFRDSSDLEIERTNSLSSYEQWSRRLFEMTQKDVDKANTALEIVEAAWTIAFKNTPQEIRELWGLPDHPTVDDFATAVHAYAEGKTPEFATSVSNIQEGVHTL